MNIKSIVEESWGNRSKVTSLGLNKKFIAEIRKQTSFLDHLNPKNVHRMYCILNDITLENAPRCICGNLPRLNKAYHYAGFVKTCSNTCQGKLLQNENIQIYLEDKNWLYQERIINQKSAEEIGKMIGCSELPVFMALKKFDIQFDARQRKTFNQEKEVHNIYRKYIESKDTLSDIELKSGISVPTLSRWFQKYSLSPKNPNSYTRKIKRTSKECQEVIDFIKSIYKDEIIVDDRSVLEGKEIDIFLPKLKIGIEYNGLFYHSEFVDKNGNTQKGKEYHLDKTEKALEKEVQLIHIFSDEWVRNKQRCKNVLSAKLNIYSSKIYARKCYVKDIEIEEKNSFLNNHHLQGEDKSLYKLGLYFNEELIAVMTFGKSRFNKKYTWELIRYAVKGGVCLIGGAEKLLVHFRRNFSGSIISYADRRWSVGRVYERLNFKLLHTNPASYWYVDMNKLLRLHRMQFQLKNIREGIDDKRTEKEIMESKGYKRIWDCGTLTYILE